MALSETPRTLEAPPGPLPQIWPTPGHTPVVEPDDRTAARAVELPANATVEMSTVALTAVAHHQDILRNIETLPIALVTRERRPKGRA
jgi:hypothetical protein